MYWFTNLSTREPFRATEIIREDAPSRWSSGGWWVRTGLGWMPIVHLSRSHYKLTTPA